MHIAFIASMLHHRPMTLLANLTSCVYCGRTANSRDHFIPLHHAGQLPNFEVPACFDCNSAAKDRVFETFHDKLAWLLARALLKGIARLETLQHSLPLINEAIYNAAIPIQGCRVCGGVLPLKYRANRIYCGAICASLAGKDMVRRNKAMQKQTSGMQNHA